METVDAKIFIVDDQPSNLKVLLTLLKNHFSTVHVADSGERALKALESFQPDVILLDVMMPEMNGYEVCRRVKENEATSAIPVIFMTALDSLEDKMAGFEAGGVDYITKPFQQAEVLARVKTHVALRKKEKELQDALDEIKRLSGIVPICSYCKQIRNDKGYWEQVERFISEYHEVTFSHGVCPSCYEKQKDALQKYLDDE